MDLTSEKPVPARLSVVYSFFLNKNLKIFEIADSKEVSLLKFQKSNIILIPDYLKVNL